MKSISEAADLMRRGQAREAERICRSRLAAGDDADAWALLAEIQAATGRAAEAAASLERLVRLSPHDASAHRQLGATLLALGRPGEAASVLRHAIELEPSSTRAHNNLGQALLQLGRSAEAIESLERALRLDERYAIGHHNLGLACLASGQRDRAIAAFTQALALDPSLVPAAINLATLHEREQHYDAALACLERAGTHRPHDPSLLTQKAHVLLSLHRAQPALESVEASLAIDPSCAEAHNVRAGALRRLGRRAEALQALDRALALDATQAEFWSNRALILHEIGEVAAAAASGRRALELDPDNIRMRTRLLARLIPSVPLTEEESQRARQSFDEELRTLENWMGSRALGEAEAFAAAQQQFFYLSYDERSNRELLEEYREACTRRLAEVGRLRHPGTAYAPAVGRLRLGIISAHVRDHSVFNAIVRGWLEHLDRERIEISLFSIGTTQDAATERARANVDHFEHGQRPAQEWARMLYARQLDVLIYPEVGMDETTLALASLKLASRQFAAWGHPETTGMPTIDGYLSADLLEPPDAQAHYSERLVRLPNLGIYGYPYGVAPEAIDRARWGIAREGTLFICPGVPFKYRPLYDRVLIEIARRLEQCTFVFFEYEIPELSHKLEARIANAFRAAGLDPHRYLRLIPWQPRAAFFGLLRAADVYLDTLGFSGFNTLMQALECELPCVTQDGRFLRGRLGSGILRRLGLSELIAADTPSYIDLAVRLAQDAPYRWRMRERIRSAAPVLYADAGAVAALDRILLEEAGTSSR